MRHIAALIVTIAVSGCSAPPRAEVVRLSWATTSTTPSTTSTTIVAREPTTTTAAEATTSTTASPAVDPRLAMAMAVPASHLSWSCRYEPGPTGDAQLHAAFVRNVARSGLPVSSQRQVLAQMGRIEAEMGLYCSAERLTGVPALVLAAIHYREAGNDPTRSIMSGELLGTINPDTDVIEGTTPLDNAIRAADHLVSGAAQIYGVGVSRRMNSIDLAYAAAAYNRGGRYCRADQLHPMKSPYVAAGLIDDNIGMIWPDLGSDDGGPESWGEPPSVRGTPDPRIGVLTLMRALGSEITAPAFSWNTDEVVIGCN